MKPSPSDQSEHEKLRAEQQLVHALLTGLHEDAAAREKRIDATMRRFEESLERVTPTVEPPRRRRVLQWLGMAAAVMFAGLLWNQFLQPSHLSAAVSRVETAAIQPVTRVYDVQLRAELRDGAKFFKRGRLHTKSTDQFVIAIGDQNRPIKFGTDGEREWYVMGRRSGYVGGEGNEWPKSPFIEERMHRFILANRFLQSLSANYEVERLDEPTPPSIGRRCTGLLGRRVLDDRRSPVEVRIWADEETGVALRVELKWEFPFRFKPQEVVLNFVGEKLMAETFYSLEHHAVDQDFVK